jgi:hypothetical protein
MSEPSVQQNITVEGLIHRLTSGRAVVGVIGLGA